MPSHRSKHDKGDLISYESALGMKSQVFVVERIKILSSVASICRYLSFNISIKCYSKFEGDIARLCPLHLYL